MATLCIFRSYTNLEKDESPVTMGARIQENETIHQKKKKEHPDFWAHCNQRCAGIIPNKHLIQNLRVIAKIAVRLNPSTPILRICELGNSLYNSSLARIVLRSFMAKFCIYCLSLLCLLQALCALLRIPGCLWTHRIIRWMRTKKESLLEAIEV